MEDVELTHGRTLKEIHCCLMDTQRKQLFTARHLIVDVSKVTHETCVDVPTERQYETVIEKAYGGVSGAFLEFGDSRDHLNLPDERTDAAPTLASR